MGVFYLNCVFSNINRVTIISNFIFMSLKSQFFQITFVSLLLLIANLQCYATFSYTISFTASGSTNTPGNVEVKNLTKGTSTLVPNGNTLTLTEQPSALFNTNSYNSDIRISQNALRSNSTLTFYAAHTGTSFLAAYTPEGKRIAGLTTFLEEGENSFNLSLPKGLYVISVLGVNYAMTAKYLSQSTDSQAEIKYLTKSKSGAKSVQKSKTNATATTIMAYSAGDQLLFKATHGNYSASVTDTPTSSKTINFTLGLQGEIFVKSTPTYEVISEPNITYAQGLSHTTYNGTTYTTLNLQLDIYKPNNSTTRRPAIILFHGGGLVSGTRTDPNIVNWANYYASRGWVAFSVRYRLAGEKGTLPQSWIDYAKNNLPSSDYGVFYKTYPAERDAKAALRWVMANAALYNVDKNFITVGGGSAGAVLSCAIGITEPVDYTTEIPVSIDPTVASIHKEEPTKVHTIVDLWGGGHAVDAITRVDGLNRYGSNDVPMFIAHGTADTVVVFKYAEDLRDNYIKSGVNHVFYPLQGWNHGPWNATVNGKRLESLAFDFIVNEQKLTVK